MFSKVVKRQGDNSWKQPISWSIMDQKSFSNLQNYFERH